MSFQVYFGEVSIRNFMSFGNQTSTLKLDVPLSHLILGLNEDTGGNNGAGKSIIINAICYALYNKAFDSISLARLLNTTNAAKKTQMEVGLSFTIDGKTINIKRSRGENTGVKVTINGVDKTPSSIAEADVFVESLLGISYELFTRVVIFSGASRPFLDLPIGDQRKLIEELFRITILSEKAVKLKEVTKSTYKDIEVQEAVAKERNGQRASYLKQVETASSRVDQWDTDKKQRIAKLQKRLDEIHSIDITAELEKFSQIETINERIAEAKELENAIALEIAEKNAILKEVASKTSGIDGDIKAFQLGIQTFEKDVSKAEADIVSIKKDSRNHDTKIDRLVKQLETLGDEITHLTDSTCPYCKQNYLADPSLVPSKEQELVKLGESIEAAEAEKPTFEQKITECLDKIANWKTSINEIRSEIAGLEKLKEPIKAEIAEAEGAVNEVKSRHSDATRQVSKCQSEKLSITKTLRYATIDQAIAATKEEDTVKADLERVKEEINPHNDALAHLIENEVEEFDNSKIDELKKVAEHQEFLVKLLTDKNSFIRRKIISRTMPFLNRRINHYTKELGLPHAVKFDDDMSCVVVEMGRELDFGNLSYGEKKRVNLSLSLAFRDVLHHLHSKMNILFIDEIDASLDSPGVEASFKLLKNKARDEKIGLWIISHRPEAVGRFDKTLTVRKASGFSSFLDE